MCLKQKEVDFAFMLTISMLLTPYKELSWQNANNMHKLAKASLLKSVLFDTYECIYGQVTSRMVHSEKLL